MKSRLSWLRALQGGHGVLAVPVAHFHVIGISVPASRRRVGAYAVGSRSKAVDTYTVGARGTSTRATAKLPFAHSSPPHVGVDTRRLG